MKLYQAPLEGITGYIYRNALFKVFGGPDKYFMPFISPYEKRIITEKEIKQLCPENNRDTKAIPQILTTDSKGFNELTDRLNSEYGYEEFNINFGCPSGTVVAKGRGAGTLADTNLLESFLDEIMSRSRYKISVKTRIGLHNKNEFQAILAIYNKYSLEELIVHPRIGDEKYKGLPHMDVYREACNNSKNPLVYNGDIDTKEAYESFVTEKYPNTIAVMIGRGMLKDPAVFREMKGGKGYSAEELREFLTVIREAYTSDFSGETPVLQKMKEIWSYMGPALIEKEEIDPRLVKNIIKSKKISEYKIYEKEIIREIV